MIGRETHRMKRSILHTLRGRMIWLALACAAGTLAAQGARAQDAPERGSVRTGLSASHGKGRPNTGLDGRYRETGKGRLQ